MARDAQERVEREKQEYYDTLTNFAKEMGVDPEKVEWAMEAKSANEATAKILPSIAKQAKDNVKGLEKKWEERFKELEGKLRKDLEIDSVDTTTSSGSGSETGGLKGVIGGAKNPREAKQALDEFIKGA